MRSMQGGGRRYRCCYPRRSSGWASIRRESASWRSAAGLGGCSLDTRSSFRRSGASTCHPRWSAWARSCARSRRDSSSDRAMTSGKSRTNRSTTASHTSSSTICPTKMLYGRTSERFSVSCGPACASRCSFSVGDRSGPAPRAFWDRVSPEMRGRGSEPRFPLFARRGKYPRSASAECSRIQSVPRPTGLSARAR